MEDLRASCVAEIGGFQFPDLQFGVLVRGAHSGISKARHESPPIVSRQRLFFSDVENSRARHIVETFGS